MFKVQNHAARTLSWWYKQRSKIDFEPTYQRKGNLWGDKDKAFLIDSILNEYDLPKIYIADFTILNTPLNKNNMSYAVIDGRQRFESIIDFYNDKIKLNDDFILFTDPSLKLGGMTFSQLRSQYPDVSEIFEEFNLDVMSVISDDSSKIKDLFVRLNKSKALTGAELRNAMEGIVPDLIRGLVDREFFKKSIKFNTNRGQDYNVASKILLIEYSGKFVDTKKKQLDNFVNSGANTDNPEPYYEAAYRAADVIDKLKIVFHENDKLLSSHGLLPIYYELAKKQIEPEQLRKFFEYFNDIRSNNLKIFKTNPDDADKELIRFESALRSINDQGSLTSAYDIMKNKLNIWLDM